MLSCTNLDKTVETASGPLAILKAITLEIKSGETAAITGVSGSGKSTLLGLLAGLDVPSRGRIRLAGHEISSLDEDARAAIRQRFVGFVFQSFQLIGGLTALENVMLPLELQGRRDARRVAIEQLVRVGLGWRTDHYPARLSGGEQQRVAIARAFVNRPGILFADEPTGNLDAETGARIKDLLFALNAEAGTTLVLVTHEAELAARCRRRFELAAGRLVDTPC